MSPIRPKFARLRGIAGGAFAGACLLVACETSVPTVPAPEQGPASRIAMQPPSRQALPETLRVAAKRPVIARMPIRGQSGVRLVDITPSATDPELFTLSLADSTAPGLPARDVPLFILDGERITDATLHGLSPMRIGTVEVLKGRMAALLYGDEGKNGVVLITTRPRGN